MVKVSNKLRSYRRSLLVYDRLQCSLLAFRLWIAGCASRLNGPSIVLMHCPHHMSGLFEASRSLLSWEVARTEVHLAKICKLKAPLILRDKEVSLCNAADEAQRAADSNDTKNLFSIVRRLAGSPPRALSTIKDEGGKVIASADEETARWRRDFQLLFKAEVVQEMAYIPNSCEASESDIVPLLNESGFAPIRSFKGSSGMGDDNVSASLLKAGGDIVVDTVLSFIREIAQLQHVPIAWRGGRLVVLYKGKGPTSDVETTICFGGFRLHTF